MIRAKSIEESFDEQMEDYFESEEYKKYDGLAIDQFNRVMNMVPEHLRSEIQALYDAMASREASVACNAYVNGFYVGLTDHKELVV